MNLPDSLVIGPQKAGTTWIHCYLQSRGDVCLPEGVKETMFFDRYYGKGKAWYADHFQPQAAMQRTIEVAPTYFHHEEAPKRIHEMLGLIPLVCTLRDPSKRSFSLYLHMRRYGMTSCTDFREAASKHPEIIGTSLYATHLKRWIGAFGREKLLILLQEDLAEQQQDYTRMLCDHLNLPFEQPGVLLQERINAATLPPSPLLAKFGQGVADRLRSAGLYPIINWAKQMGLKSLFFGTSGRAMPALSADERRWAVAQFQNEIDELEVILQRDLSRWRVC